MGGDGTKGEEEGKGKRSQKNDKKAQSERLKELQLHKKD